MKKHLIPFVPAMVSLAVFGCSETKTPATENKAAEPVAKSAPAENTAVEKASPTENAVEGTKTVTLANGAKVIWMQDNQDEKLNPRSLFSDASDSLYNIGINADDITLIYLTHFHADHIAGLVTKDGEGKDVKVFKNASVYAGKVEYDAWMNDIPKNDLQKMVMEIYKDSLHLFAFGDSLPNGVLALDAVGHTPGHTVFQFGNLLVIGDLMHGYALQKDHPEINSNYDMDKEKSIESRKRIMQYARENKLLMAGMHLPPPGFAE